MKEWRIRFKYLVAIFLQRSLVGFGRITPALRAGDVAYSVGDRHIVRILCRAGQVANDKFLNGLSEEEKLKKDKPFMVLCGWTDVAFNQPPIFHKKFFNIEDLRLIPNFENHESIEDRYKDIYWWLAI